MVTPAQLIERANEWLKDKGAGPLTPDEIVGIVGAMILVTDTATTVVDLETKLAECTARIVCKFRGYAIPVIS